MIFLSHNYADKPVVEPVAIRLRDIFGKDKVFYDSWSIQPGDGIIKRMNDGLTSPRFVFFFVSENSLNSKMVELEWQTALFKATHGECKIIPIRVDGADMPAILMQNLYIDMFVQGIEATILQIVNVAQGNNTFTPQHQGFSNLTWTIDGDPSKEVVITILASHLMEPNPDFLILLTNNEGEFRISFKDGQPTLSGFTKDLTLSNGLTGNAHSIKPMGGAITPKIPMKIKVEAVGDVPINILAVLHRSSYEQYSLIPQRLRSSISAFA